MCLHTCIIQFVGRTESTASSNAFAIVFFSLKFVMACFYFFFDECFFSRLFGTDYDSCLTSAEIVVILFYFVRLQ